MNLETLTTAERLILSNQFRILAKLNEGQEDGYLQKAEIVESGHVALYDELADNLMEGTTAEIGEETHQILSMYQAINGAIDSIPTEEKATLNLDAIKFSGFDGNADKHYFFTKYMVENMDGMYEEFKGKELNSHTAASLPKYRRILRAYNAILESNNHRFEPKDLPILIQASAPGSSYDEPYVGVIL